MCSAGGVTERSGLVLPPRDIPHCDDSVLDGVTRPYASCRLVHVGIGFQLRHKTGHFTKTGSMGQADFLSASGILPMCVFGQLLARWLAYDSWMATLTLHEFIDVNRDALIGRCRVKVAERASPPPTELEIDHGVPSSSINS